MSHTGVTEVTVCRSAVYLVLFEPSVLLFRLIDLGGLCSFLNTFALSYWADCGILCDRAIQILVDLEQFGDLAV